MLPPGCVSPTGPFLTRSADTYRIGWLVQILPYLDEVPAYRQVNFDTPQLSFLYQEEIAAMQLPQNGSTEPTPMNRVLHLNPGLMLKPFLKAIFSPGLAWVAAFGGRFVAQSFADSSSLSVVQL